MTIHRRRQREALVLVRMISQYLHGTRHTNHLGGSETEVGPENILDGRGVQDQPATLSKLFARAKSFSLNPVASTDGNA